jgi:hypothetical protein
MSFHIRYVTSPPAASSSVFRRDSLACSPFNSVDKGIFECIQDTKSDIDTAKFIAELWSSFTSYSEDLISQFITEYILNQISKLASVELRSTEEEFELSVLLSKLKSMSYLSLNTTTRSLCSKLMLEYDFNPSPSRFEPVNEFPSLLKVNEVFSWDALGSLRITHLDWALMTHPELHKRYNRILFESIFQSQSV